MFQFELLFSVESESDPAILLVKSLIESYPKVDAKLFIGKNFTTFLRKNILMMELIICSVSLGFVEVCPKKVILGF